ncbi:hypothetical protein B5G52_19395 [Pseudoalteromonas sp. A601]|uniref:DUF6445 family protein n=1 Tax=Pseudoalteromonas sp. A601 TaxID=1967839 RepID=UPI000B3D301F|nr:DUF6445 family protein [Pseudoalteromonas sp. A601]OUS68493.1 hypothetical protein B5G52_19395 [Pseudoalteromonas sp. A601]
MKQLELNPNYKVTSIKINDINEDILIVDDFIKDLEPIMHFAKQYAYLQPVGSDGTLYPGKRDDMPEPYFKVFIKLINNLLEKKHLNTDDKNVYLHKAKLSLVTLEPKDLNTLQKMPHVDSTDDKTFAAVHYLVGGEFGGTAIYRYIPFNLIKITKDKEHLAHQMITQVKNNPIQHQSYLSDNTSLFEKVVNVSAKLNRVVLYKSNLLHSANLKDKINYIDDINLGRLSISSFFRID